MAEPETTEHEDCGCTADYCHICGPTKALLNEATRPSSGHRYGPDFLYTQTSGGGGEIVGGAWHGWVPLGYTTDGLEISGVREGDGREVWRTVDYTNNVATMTITDPDAVRAISRQVFGDWTVGEALKFLDPAPPRRTLSRWLAGMPPVGSRKLPQGGPPAATYSIPEVMRRHARWALEQAKKDHR